MILPMQWLHCVWVDLVATAVLVYMLQRLRSSFHAVLRSSLGAGVLLGAMS